MHVPRIVRSIETDGPMGGTFVAIDDETATGGKQLVDDSGTDSCATEFFHVVTLHDVIDADFVEVPDGNGIAHPVAAKFDEVLRRKDVIMSELRENSR